MKEFGEVYEGSTMADSGRTQYSYLEYGYCAAVVTSELLKSAAESMIRVFRRGDTIAGCQSSPRLRRSVKDYSKK